LGGSKCEYPLLFFYAVIAQLVERVPSKYEVAGSNPVYRSKVMWLNKELRALKALAEQLKSWNVGLYRTMS
jgi:hypothetical protein